MVRQRRFKAARRLLGLFGVVVTVWASTGCGGGGSGMIAVEGSSASVPSPEVPSTGPVLRWTEFDPGVDQPGRLFSVGDGRVVIGGQRAGAEPYFVVTADGSDWSELHLPPSIWPTSLDVTGDLWAVAGWPRDSPRHASVRGRIYVSDDEGSTWREVRPETASRELPEHTLAHPIVVAVATSGPHVVAAVRTHLSLDFEVLLRDRGLLPPGSDPRWISIDGDGVGFDMIVEPASDASQPDSASQMPDEPLRFTVGELGLSAAQMAIIEGAHDPRPIRIYSGSGPVLTETAVLDGWRASAVGNDSGFVLLIDAGGGMVTLFTSPDGQAWSDQTPDALPARARFDSSALESDGTVWMLRTDGTDSYLTRWSDGSSDVQVTRLGDFPPLAQFSAGPAGLAATATQPRSQSSAEGSDTSGRPVGRVAKDGYELRYGEPQGGVTLWDLAADAAVYEFGPETLDSIEPPEGVREVEEGDDFELTFEDPDTGEDLVTFTRDDLETVFSAQTETAGSQSPETWVGWSADGENWGWQTVGEAFGLGDAEASASVAMGENYVIASVQVFDVAASDSSESGDHATVTWSNGASRWFIARMP
ncbi:MAG: hypothetical protein F4Z53_03940 [Acidimicrobiales bacterium]|nr:hypothetical protein [Acidimicrobiales bacterium]MYD35103.1 hypothetical protein [Acidimicrobiales bacterium]MYI08695.1 hypothetical protein [Acidimicrobiales bacterium]